MRPGDRHASPSLQARLEAALGGARPKRAIVGRSAGGRRVHAAVGPSPDRAEAQVFRTGCVTKLLGAALLERKLRRHALAVDMPIRSVLRDVRSAAPLGATTLRHLLEHTHGLDDSDLAAAPLEADGRVDLEHLIARLAPRRFASPGRLYSYSNAGAWILAGILERLDRRPFAEQLRDDLLEPLGICLRRRRRAIAGPARICAATGGGLALTVADLLTFLEASAPSLARDLSARGVEHASTPLPGWHPLERGVRAGWKQYGGGWLGHQSAWPGASLLLGVRPGDGSAFVVASEGPNAAVVAAKVLGRELPDLFASALPRPLSAAAAARVDPTRYCGRYACAAETLEVEAAAGGLTLRSDRSRTRLIAARQHVFFLEAPGPQRAFVQLVARADEPRRLLWDGRRVLPLAESSRPALRRDARRES